LVAFIGPRSIAFVVAFFFVLLAAVIRRRENPRLDDLVDRAAG